MVASPTRLLYVALNETKPTATRKESMNTYEIGFNTENKKTGKTMTAKGMRGSWLAYLGQAMKGHSVEGVSPLTEIRKGGKFVVFAGAPVEVWIHHMREDLYRVSWLRPEGRTNSYHEAEATTAVARQVTVRCPEDPAEFLATIEERIGQTLTIEAV